MHSRLFQLSLEPIEEDDLIDDFDLQYNFIGQIADYARDSVDKEDDLEWLESVIGKHGAVIDHKKKTICFEEGFKLSYFKKKFDSFKERVSDLTLETFAGISKGSSMDLYVVEKLLEDKFDFYIYIDYPQCLDDFVRDLEEGKTYYFGNIIDYHF